MKFFLFLDWPWANLLLLAQRQKNTDVYKGLLPWEGFPGQTWSLCHGNVHHGIDPNMSNSGHHDCSKKAVFLCTAVKLAILPHVGTLNSAYWAFSTFQSAFIWAIALYNCSMKFFLFLDWPWANLALLAQRQKSTDVYKGLLPWEGFPGQTWSLCHGNVHHGIDPNMSNSGHHDCSRKAVFRCTAVKLQSCHMSTGQNSLFGEYAITKSRWSPIGY